MRADRGVRSERKRAFKGEHGLRRRKKRRCGDDDLSTQCVQRPRDSIVLIARDNDPSAGTDETLDGNIQSVRRVHRKDDLLDRWHREKCRRCTAAAKQRFFRLLCRGITAASGRAHRAHRLHDGPLHRGRLLKGRGGVVKVDHSAISRIVPFELRSVLTGSTPPARQACAARAKYLAETSKV